MPDIVVNIDIYCDICGAALCGDTTARSTNRNKDQAFYVIPCEKCIQAAMDKGYTAGWEEGGGS